MSLPNLLIVGAAKCGTTSLHEYLKQHPDIFMSSHKEPHFLINQEIGKSRIHKGITELKEYKKLFLEGKSLKYRGESSVMYLLFSDITIKNIKKYLGEEVKIIIMLRNPVDRAYSGYQHNRRYNVLETLSFEDAINQTEQRYKDQKDMTPATRYLELGLYYNQVKKFQDNFTDVHIVLYDDYLQEINICFDRIFDFLNIKKINIDSSKRHMIGGWVWKYNFIKRILVSKNKFKSMIKSLIPIASLRKIIRNTLTHLSIRHTEDLKAETRNKLIEFYRKDINKLSSLINRDLSHWTDKQ